mmetsp:Transcript_35480/g.56759  ORF Transcript_35480/g.56759 Transcript_35480/m.56759 type:complete len:85 (-) Transcript_35480:2-256(-)
MIPSHNLYLPKCVLPTILQEVNLLEQFFLMIFKRPHLVSIIKCNPNAKLEQTETAKAIVHTTRVIYLTATTVFQRPATGTLKGK